MIGIKTIMATILKKAIIEKGAGTSREITAANKPPQNQSLPAN
jgi:hypothetical protein